MVDFIAPNQLFAIQKNQFIDSHSNVTTSMLNCYFRSISQVQSATIPTESPEFP